MPPKSEKPLEVLPKPNPKEVKAHERRMAKILAQAQEAADHAEVMTPEEEQARKEAEKIRKRFDKSLKT